MTYGPLDLMVHVGEYMNSNVSDSTCDVARLDFPAVIKELLGAVSKTSNERESQSDSDYSDLFSEDEEQARSHSQPAPRKCRKMEKSRFQLKKALSVPPVDKFLVRRAHLNIWRMKSSFI